jgi:1,2-diacylglycerol 3-alpha-glucosyltransferase
VNMSSRITGFEPTMIEAMAKRKVIIGSELSPMSDVIEDGQEGFLLRPADTGSLSHLLVELLSGSLPSLEIGQKASDKVNNLFDPRKMIDALNAAYLQILKTSPRPLARLAPPNAVLGGSPSKSPSPN